MQLIWGKEEIDAINFFVFPEMLHENWPHNEKNVDTSSWWTFVLLTKIIDALSWLSLAPHRSRKSEHILNIALLGLVAINQTLAWWNKNKHTITDPSL